MDQQTNKQTGSLRAHTTLCLGGKTVIQHMKYTKKKTPKQAQEKGGGSIVVIWRSYFFPNIAMAHIHHQPLHANNCSRLFSRSAITKSPPPPPLPPPTRQMPSTPLNCPGAEPQAPNWRRHCPCGENTWIWLLPLSATSRKPWRRRKKIADGKKGDLWF